MKHLLVSLLLVGLIALASCAPLGTVPGSVPPATTVAPVQAPAISTVGAPAVTAPHAPAAPTTGPALPVTTTPELQTQGASASAAACPGPNDELQRLVSTAGGYCLTYPAEYKVEKSGPFNTLLVIGGWLNSGDPRAHITVTDAQGKTLEQAAQQLEADYNVGYDPKRSGTTVAGEPAVVFDGLIGEDVNRRVLFVHAGTLYELYFAPSDPANADVYGRLETLYKQVIGSFTFIPRSASVYGDIGDCLSPSAITRLLTDRERGFCLLYPAGFTLDESAGGTLALAPGSQEGGQRSNVTVVIEVREARGKTAEQLADELVTEAERATPEQRVEPSFGLTIGYEPAQLLHGVPGPELSRHVLAVHDGKLYHLTFTPDGPAGDRAGTQMQALYDLVVRSFRFVSRHQ